MGMRRTPSAIQPACAEVSGDALFGGATEFVIKLPFEPAYRYLPVFRRRPRRRNQRRCRRWQLRFLPPPLFPGGSPRFRPPPPPACALGGNPPGRAPPSSAVIHFLPRMGSPSA